MSLCEPFRSRVGGNRDSAPKAHLANLERESEFWEQRSVDEIVEQYSKPEKP